MGKKRESPDSKLRKHVLPLNNALPEEFGIYWVSAEEILQRLIYSGVRNSLTLQMVQGALRHNNKDDIHIKTREYGGQNWFRSRIVDDNNGEKKGNELLPHEQRFRRKGGARNRLASCINPARDYFVHSENVHFTALNRELERFEQKMEENRQREEEERERQKSEKNYHYIAASNMCQY